LRLEFILAFDDNETGYHSGVRLPLPLERYHMSRVIKAAPRFPGYFVGSDGTAWSKLTGTMRQLKTPLTTQGYPHCGMVRDGRRKGVLVHRLVCEAFHGPQPSPKHEVRHLNGIRTDGRSENLCWGTRAENMEDAVKHGTATVGERNKNAKLTQKDAEDIRRLYRFGFGSQYTLAEVYGVSRRTIQCIVQNRKYIRERLGK
jgi:hypothetical protein